MKKLLWITMSMMLLLASCKKDEEPASETKTTEASNRFYGVKYPEGKIETKGVAQKDNLWHASATIKVKFLGAPAATYQNKVKTYAAAWEKHASIKFEFVTSGDADVRIGFDHDSKYVTWAYTGTDCKFETDQSKVTLNFADWAYLSETEIKGDVLRAFGQVLGLELEHRHLESGITWRKDMQTYWEGQIEDIAWADLQKYVFTPLNKADIVATQEYDAASVMVWPFPRNHTNIASNPNFELSEKDIEFIKQLYPKGMEVEGDPIIILKATWNMVDIHMNMNSDIVVDWGDGTLQAYSKNDGVAHTYKTTKEHTVKVYGSTDAINMLHFEGGGITMLDISRNEFLEGLFCIYNGDLTTLDVSKNTRLKVLTCYSNSITKLDLSNCNVLSSLTLHNNKLTSLLLPKHNKVLGGIDCRHNELTRLDIPEGSAYTYVFCDNNQLETITFPVNCLIEQFSCDKNKLESLDVSNCNSLYSLRGRLNYIKSLKLPTTNKLQHIDLPHSSFESKDIVSNLFQALPYRTVSSGGGIMYMSVSLQNMPISDYEAILEMAEEVFFDKNWTIRFN